MISLSLSLIFCKRDMGYMKKTCSKAWQRKKRRNKKAKRKKGYIGERVS
jgi:hypothetical protein